MRQSVNNLVTTFIKPVINKKPTRTVYNYRKANWDQIREDMAHFRDQYLCEYSLNSVEGNWIKFKKALFESMDKHIPKKTIKGKADVPWMTKKLKRQIKKKKRLYKKTKKCNDSKSTKAFHDFRKEVRNLMHTEYYKYINNLLEPESDKTSQSFWKYIKSRKQDSVSIGTLKDNGRIAESAKDKAEMFNQTFCSVFTREDLDNIPDKGPSPYQPMSHIHITLNGVIKCVKRLNPKKACGPDKMPILVLQETANEIAPVLQSLFQQSLNESKIPSDWKKANIVPIFKKGDRTKPSNYRLVSLTAVVSKMLEHIVVAQIMDHLDSQNILHENQHGFRARRSCESQLLLTTDDIARSLNQSYQVDMGILDFAKAFDKVSHTRLSRKMEYYGIQGSTLNWVTDFLRGRNQQVVIDGETSDPAEVTSGVPQGTVLGPTLFLIYINDIAENINSNIRLFADDCVVYRQIDFPQDHVILQDDLNKLVDWSNTWQMKFNVDKCVVMNFGTSRTKTKYEYKMNNQTLETVKHNPYLGVELTDNLKYNDHINTITSKASRVLGFVKRNLKHCPRTVKERAYQTLVRPKLEYSSPIWNPQHKDPIKKIEQVQRNAARFVLNKPYNRQNPTSVTTMLQQLNWPTLEDRRKASDLILMYKVVNSLVAVPVNYLPPRSPRYADCIRFIAYHCRVNVYQHSFFPRIVIPWNRLPDTTINLQSLDGFKLAVQPVHRM